MDYEIKTGFLDLSLTLFCGQCFRFVAENGVFSGVVGSRTLTAVQNPDGITLKNICAQDIPFWEDYFDLALDYEKVISGFGNDPILKKACENRGIRVLKQEPFETLISFIISQNNNIKRIGGIIERLCNCFGEKIDAEHYAFPTPERMAELCEEELAPLRAGFRARYIIDAVKKIKNGEIVLENIYGMTADEGRSELKKITGVGDKVADCVLLFGFHKLDCVPKDVWVKRIISAYYPDGFPECVGEFAGIAQQYLFDYVRKNGI